jgi:hypothetical protein
MSALKYVEPYAGFRNYGGFKTSWIGLKAKLAPDSLGHRRELGLLLNAQKLTGRGAEIGVTKGKFSERILHYWRGELLFSIDPWREFGEDHRGSANVAQAQQDSYFSETQGRLARFNGRSRILRMTSEEAAHEIEDGSLDFAYLDAHHHYEAVKQDIALWWPKVRPGGLLCGHDYSDENETDAKGVVSVFEVKRAVDEFVRESGAKFFKTSKDKRPSWFVRKK